MASILIVDDEPKIRHILKIMLSLKGHSIYEAEDGEDALILLQKEPVDLVISDIKMPKMDGLTLLERIKDMNLSCPVVFITAFATIDSCVEAMQKGAVDYITKPFDEQRILLTIEKALGISRILAENKSLKDELSKKFESDIVCVSPAMKQVLELALKVAQKSDTTVLITGESGTGKEVVARFIHNHSPRAGKRFVAINCAAISPNLVESTLFGHERGAFTGADRRKEGLFEYANQGTLFLDEIGELPFEVQAKLLRALQERVIQRVGGNEQIKVDVRVLCATNQNLQQMVNKGRFREDLFYRINVFPIQIPSLQERKEDIVPLAEHFARKFTGKTDPNAILFTNGAKRLLEEYHWPGNVRELVNAVERAVILAGDQPITADELSFLRVRGPASSIFEDFKLPPGGISLEELEKELIRQALQRTNNNQSAAAKLLGLTRAKFRTFLKQLNEGHEDND